MTHELIFIDKRTESWDLVGAEEVLWALFGHPPVFGPLFCFLLLPTFRSQNEY